MGGSDRRLRLFRQPALKFVTDVDNWYLFKCSRWINFLVTFCHVASVTTQKGVPAIKSIAQSQQNGKHFTSLQQWVSLENLVKIPLDECQPKDHQDDVCNNDCTSTMIIMMTMMINWFIKSYKVVVTSEAVTSEILLCTPTLVFLLDTTADIRFNSLQSNATSVAFSYVKYSSL